jgi:hypothetical protein
MQQDWPEDRMPALTLRANLFSRNATLFKEERDDTGDFAGKFGSNPRYLILDVEDIGDNFDYTAEGNVSFDPGLELENLLEVTPPEDEEDEYDQDVMVEGFAPAMRYDPDAIPLPAEERARAYGVNPDRVWSR